MEEFFRGNSRITSDCPVCSMLKTLSGCFMLAEIVRNSFTDRGDLSELWSQICLVTIFNPCQELYLLGGANDLFRREPRRIMINSTESNNNASILLVHLSLPECSEA